MTTWSFVDGEWLDGNPGLIGPMTHAIWQGSCVFDGARAFEGVAPDLDRHCQRVNNSARALGLKPLHETGKILELCQEGLARFPKDAAVYIRPMYWAEGGFVDGDPETTRFCLSIYDAPLPQPNAASLTLSPFRRPTIETAPTNAKAACLYPNSGRALREARSRGFDNAVMLDAAGNVAELTASNVWLAKDGAAHTPVPNGTFLNGITRQRVIKLLREAGIQVYERSITWQDVLEADEIFQTGNYAKVLPFTRIEDRDLQPGPIYTRARELYWNWAHGG